jgi:DNA modification methylase
LAHRAAATATSSFGVGRRESHDSSDFYARFTPPVVSARDDLMPASPTNVNVIHCGNARAMDDVDDGSVALVVTSPPYFAGKEYEEALGEGHIPATYFEYLQLLADVFAECVHKLEPGGRIAINVANLGRKPYRSLSADVISILQDQLGLLLRGEILWVKGKATGSSCAWGSFQSAANPVLRDLSERIIVASKGRFDRALSRRKRAKLGLPSVVSISADEFLESTTDIWFMPPESAHHVGHPAPFPVELPERLIHLYTYRGDVVLDPFIGSGTTAVAAVATRRNYIGYDTDEKYVRTAIARVEQEGRRTAELTEHEVRDVALPALRQVTADDRDPWSRAVTEGRQAKDIAHEVLRAAGFDDIEQDKRLSGGVEVALAAVDQRGHRWLFEVCGAFTSSRAGLKRSEAVWKALGKAAVLSSAEPGDWDLVFLTTDLPETGAGAAALEAARGHVYTDAVDMLSVEGRRLLDDFAKGRCRNAHTHRSGARKRSKK